MSSLSSLGLAFYVVVLIGAFAVRSAAGFGAVLIAVPMLAFVLPVPTAVAVATALTVVTSTQQVSRGWSQIAWAQFFIVSFYTMIGIGLGFYFISTLNENALRRGLGGFLILYSIYALWTRGASPVLPTRWHGALAAAAGIIAGFFGALFGGGVGPIYVVYFNVLRMNKEVFRVTMSTVRAGVGRGSHHRICKLRVLRALDDDALGARIAAGVCRLVARRPACTMARPSEVWHARRRSGFP